MPIHCARANTDADCSSVEGWLAGDAALHIWVFSSLGPYDKPCSASLYGWCEQEIHLYLFYHPPPKKTHTHFPSFPDWAVVLAQ